jgi:hypothetical protein
MERMSTFVHVDVYFKTRWSVHLYTVVFPVNVLWLCDGVCMYIFVHNDKGSLSLHDGMYTYIFLHCDDLSINAVVLG